MTATRLDRRRFLALGSLGAAAVVGRPAFVGPPAIAGRPAGLASSPGVAGAAAGEPSPHAGAGAAPEAGPVRMTGDGLGLTPAETAARWTELAADGRVERDSYSNGGAVAALEAHFAEVLGKERAVFLPTGTLANHLAVRTLAGGTGRAVVQAESHLFNDSGDCVQTLSGITLMPLGPGRAGFRLDEVQEVIARTAGGRVSRPVSVISIETPVRRRYGETFDQAELDRITAFAKREGIGLHLDGARIFLQSAATGRAVSDYARPFDTVYVSLYKYFNSVSGAVLAGPRALLDELYHVRRMFGAGLPGAWPFAALARHYAPGFTERFRQALAVSEAFIERLGGHGAFAVERVPAGTNLFTLRVAQADGAAFRARLGRRGIHLGAPRGLGRGDSDGGEPGRARFLLAVNETWNRRSADALADTFIGALRT
ncbi:MAG: beta-eliminating lyase-related protein [Acidobacteria bacterium]|nr:beta-eliminating lyase-related protein [Acidobacteriota bacterium]